MPELRINVDPDLFEEVQRVAALNNATLAQVAAILLRGGLADQRRRQGG